jgi:hypothetical protein
MLYVRMIRLSATRAPVKLKPKNNLYYYYFYFSACYIFLPGCQLKYIRVNTKAANSNRKTLYIVVLIYENLLQFAARQARADANVLTNRLLNSTSGGISSTSP